MKRSQKRTLNFGGKLESFLGRKNQDKRQCLSSAYVYLSYRRSSAYVPAYLALTGLNESFANKAFRSTLCLEKTVRPGASCGFLENRHKPALRTAL